ncbi:MAG: glycosyltransferase family 1 protein [Thioalkalispiraceae bacterium]|jgi:glycosyltransferase involved in cell wall biosynthesis
MSDIAPKELHVAFVTETFPPEINGVAHTLNMLVTGLNNLGYRVSLIRPRQNSADIKRNDDSITTYFARGLKIPGYDGLQFGMPHFFRLSKWWKSDRPDIAYIATEGPLGYAAVHTARKLGIPAVSGFHTNFHQYANHYKLGFITKLVFKYLKHFHNATNTTLVPSPDLANTLDAMGIKPVNIMGRGVDTKLFTPKKRTEALREQWGAGNDDLVLLCVGRVAAEKNLELAIRAYRSLQEYFSNIKMVIVGNGPLLKPLSDANPDIIFTGEITDTSLSAHYASSDLFIFPSESETFGNVTLEAMASGLPVIAFDYAAANIHITHQYNGILVEKGNYDDFILKVITAVKNREQLSKLGINAAQYSQKISWQSIVEQFQTLLLTQIQNLHQANNDELPGFNEAK